MHFFRGLDIYNLCVRKNYCTKATSEYYSQLLNNVERLSKKQIAVAIAKVTPDVTWEGVLEEINHIDDIYKGE